MSGTHSSMQDPARHWLRHIAAAPEGDERVSATRRNARRLSESPPRTSPRRNRCQIANVPVASADPVRSPELLHVPELTPEHEEQVEERVSPSAHVLHEAIRREAEDELARSPSSLWWSGLAAGLSMGFSVVTQGLLRSHLPDAPWRPLVTNFGYTIGFLIVVLGHQQLFTENTVTPIISVLARQRRQDAAPDPALVAHRPCRKSCWRGYLRHRDRPHGDLP